MYISKRLLFSSAAILFLLIAFFVFNKPSSLQAQEAQTRTLLNNELQVGSGSGIPAYEQNCGDKSGSFFANLVDVDFFVSSCSRGRTFIGNGLRVQDQGDPVDLVIARANCTNPNPDPASWPVIRGCSLGGLYWQGYHKGQGYDSSYQTMIYSRAAEDLIKDSTGAFDGGDLYIATAPKGPDPVQPKNRLGVRNDGAIWIYPADNNAIESPDSGAIALYTAGCQVKAKYKTSNEVLERVVVDFCTSQTQPVVWHSYDVVTQSGSPQAVVAGSNNGPQAQLRLYASTNDNGVDEGTLFSTFNAGINPDLNNRAEKYWANESGVSYTYVGKSTVDRGSDTGESNTPAPTGVRDLQFHPPNSEKLTVAAFVAPADGQYKLTDLAARRVDANTGQLSSLKVFNKNKSLIATVNATGNSWTTNTQTFDLGTLTAGDKIYFAVDNEGGYWWDITETNWTITKQ